MVPNSTLQHRCYLNCLLLKNVEKRPNYDSEHRQQGIAVENNLVA